MRTAPRGTAALLDRTGWKMRPLVDVADDASECPDLQVPIAMHRNRGVLVAALKEVVAATDANHVEALLLKEADHLLPRRTGQFSHGRTQRD